MPIATEIFTQFSFWGFPQTTSTAKYRPGESDRLSQAATAEPHWRAPRAAKCRPRESDRLRESETESEIESESGSESESERACESESETENESEE